MAWVPGSKGQAWFCTTGLPSDITVEVDDMTFHLHKFPLMSKSRKLNQLIQEQESELQAAVSPYDDEDENGDEIQQLDCHIVLEDFPGGCETFEVAAKFCYGVKIELSSTNAAPLRCAAEYLEMTEEYSEDNLISKTEMYLSQHSLKDAIKTLISCERLLPLAEDLNIVQRCIESVANKASTTDPSLFGWPVIEQPPSRRKSKSKSNTWLDDLSLLSLDLFTRIISCMKNKLISSEIIEVCLIFYAKRYIPGISRSNRKPLQLPSSSSSSSACSEMQQKEMLETIVMHLPEERSLRSSIRVLFGLLRTANILNASESPRFILEKKIGLILQEATLDDLLIPSYSYLNETLYDVDCVERILSHFLDGLQNEDLDENGEVKSAALMLVGKLIDGYLSEIASDANLKPEKFYDLAIRLPDQSRHFDDGLYRAVDVYLKAHPWITEGERERVSGVMDCQKLTLEACTHAAQNERLPLRAVIQVLFFEQLQLRHAIAGTIITADTADTERPSITRAENESEEEEEAAGVGRELVVHNATGGPWRSAVRENLVLKLDMDTMRSRVHQLERECSTMKKVIEKIDKPTSTKKGGLTGRFGCKFKTQVCDSHESTVVDTRKNRRQHHNHQHQQ